MSKQKKKKLVTPKTISEQISNLLNILFIADIHFGNNRIPPEQLYKNLKKFFISKIKDSDIVLIGGDLFHTLLNINDDYAFYAMIFINELIIECEKHNVLIRVVRGTFSHDRKNQLKMFDALKSPNVSFFDTISIEHIEPLDINILYIPDDLEFNNADEVIVDLMKSNNLSTVDIVLGHGYFTHVLPKGIPSSPPNTFTADFFRNKVTGPVLFGHVHTPSVYKNVIYSGSFERMAFGEEERKGFFAISYDKKNKKSTHTFIENTDSIPFVDIHLNSHSGIIPDYEKLLNGIKVKLSNCIKSNDQLFYVRLICSNVELRSSLAGELNTLYPNIVVSQKKDTDSKKNNTLDTHLNIEQLEPITKEKLPTMIQTFVKDKFDVTMDVARISSVLNEELTYG